MYGKHQKINITSNLKASFLETDATHQQRSFLGLEMIEVILGTSNFCALHPRALYRHGPLQQNNNIIRLELLNETFDKYPN